MSSNGTGNPATPASSPPASNPPSSADVPQSSPAPPPPSATPTPPQSSQAPPPSSNPPPPASSSQPPPPPSSSSPPPASSPPPVSSPERTVTAPSATPSATVVQTILITPSASVAGETPVPSTVVITVTPSAPSQSQPANAVSSNSADPSSTDPAQLQGARKDASNGLSTGGKTAIAVVIPLVVVALLVLGALFFWRKRKQRKNNEDERRKEVEEYGFNPNHDPTLPAVGIAPQMAEDSSGYRGWGNTATSSGRKASTTLTSGMTHSDSASNPGGYQSPHSPTNAYSDANSNDPLVNGRRETLDSDGIAALGVAPNATHNQGVARGPSNASSSYSAANRSDNSGDYPGMGNNTQEYYDQSGYGSYQDGPYAGGASGQPIIRDVSARRNTRIENPSVYPQGNSGVATNF